MAPRYPTPPDLVEALQQRGDGARAQLHEMLYFPIDRLMEAMRGRYRLQHEQEMLTRNALHAGETYLRTRPISTFASVSWPAFRAAVLLHIAKLASQPQAPQLVSRSRQGELPRSLCYSSEIYSLPYERVGDSWFSGDWFGGRELSDGSLWILLADITGHGYHAYLLASTLPDIWQRCWEPAPSTPAELLAAMHDLLADCLPEGVYVECTLARLYSDGEVVVAPAGGSRLLLRRGRQETPVLLKMRGPWLGLIRPSPAEQQTWTLEDGDELLLATDGLFDQLHEHTPIDVVQRLGRIAGGAGLFERVRALLQQALEHTEQKDDITMVLVRRHGRIAEAAAAGPHEDLSSPNGTADVSV
ncbi:MAG TPA: PP2C family protein-serine/threonine phosphatase [Gemmataceae bacterium]|nr:PP2C family protein-serine/threonine phosphatase [Gemmataceae bacterium]